MKRQSTSRGGRGPGSRFGVSELGRHWQRFTALALLLTLAVPARAQESAPGPSVVETPGQLQQVRLIGKLGGGEASFTLHALAHIPGRHGATLDVLGGNVALTGFSADKRRRLQLKDGRYQIVFDRAGDYPVELAFRSAVESKDGWNRVKFAVAPGSMQKIILQQLAPDSEFDFRGAALPERSGDDFVSTLPLDGQVDLAWKEARVEGEGKLFFAAEGFDQIGVGQGLLRHTAIFRFQVMQGELAEVRFDLRGEGEITRVQGSAVLAWTVEPATAQEPRRLVVRLNQPQRETFQIVAQMQQTLEALPLAIDPPGLRPVGATRWAGHLRVINEGAVRLEVLRSDGLSQISPEQFPASDELRGLGLTAGSQTFAYRFSGGDFHLRLQADNILPELSVSELIQYHLGETELAIEAELELDVREAPLRELSLGVPGGYGIARLQASGMSDYFSTESTNGSATLRIVYAEPVTGRQVVQLRLEQNRPQTQSTWMLPPIRVARAKSVRGNLGVSADAGFRLTPAITEGLTELATAYFPKRVAGLQGAYRLSDPDWRASMSVERLSQSIQADTFHLFSVAEGIAYGSSLVNYLISGAPVSQLRLELSGEYFNVEFTGREIRNWQKVEGGFVVYLHTPVAGAYTLLATYERPFRSQGETLGFSGAQPLDAQSEQGYSLVISDYQFQVSPVNVSPNLLALEPGEVPPEYRLFFDAPVLAAYRYTARPFNLQLELQPLRQGETLKQVVDRAVIHTRLSSEGQVIIDAQYFVKSRGAPWLRLKVPHDLKLWSATVDGHPSVPVTEVDSTLIPLLGRSDSEAAQVIDLKLAGRSANADQPAIALPQVDAPILLADWVVSTDPHHRLAYRSGSITPAGGLHDFSGFEGLKRLFSSPVGWMHLGRLASALVLMLLTAYVWRKTTEGDVFRWSRRHVAGTVVGSAAALLAVALIGQLAEASRGLSVSAPEDMRFLIPVQQAGAATQVELSNKEIGAGWQAQLDLLWPAALGLMVWVVAALRGPGPARRWGMAAAWTGLAWAALRFPNGLPWFWLVLVAYALVHLLLSGWRRLAQVPHRPLPNGVTATGAALVALLGFAGSGGLCPAQADSAESIQLGCPDSLVQEVKVEKGFAFATADLAWTAEKDEVLVVLHEPAVLTSFRFPEDDLEQVTLKVGEGQAVALRARRPGNFAISFSYHLRVDTTSDGGGLTLPTGAALVNRVALKLAELEADVSCATAVAVERDPGSPPQTTSVRLFLRPDARAAIHWQPRARDTRQEQTVFYAEVRQGYVPEAGVLEGLHEVLLRPAQGEMGEITCNVPAGFTIANVTAENLASWRFDPDTGRLRLVLNPPQSRPVTVTVHSQVATGPLPYQQAVGVLRVEGAAGQVELVGVATGDDVQLEDAEGGGFSAINLEDFPATPLQTFQGGIAGLAVRRAYRCDDAAGALVVTVAAVQPDVRVETQQTLSLGEDRIVLAGNLSAEISRAGIFRLTFDLPKELEVESISGESLSHWTLLKNEDVRTVTLHLKGKTSGLQQFALTLSGPGLRQATNWSLPRISLREAAKQRGQLVVVPEQGMRLQVIRREGVTQLDPARSGIRQKGVLAFRLLQDPWLVNLEVEQVDAWIQVASLQEARVGEGQLKVNANLQYEIENTGVKSLHVRLPQSAEGVLFQGEQIADFLVTPQPGNTNSLWEVKLHRRVLGSYLLRVSYLIPIPDSTDQVALEGIQSEDANSQRGFVAVRADGRLQLRLGDPPAALQPAEWQSIPRRLQTDASLTAAPHTFRLVEPNFVLPIQLERRQAVALLPAQVNGVTLTSVISDDGVMLTRAHVELVPGDKRLLRLELPAEARFWFAYVNQRGVWPWKGTNDQLLLPLEQHSPAGQNTVVEFLYTVPTPPAKGRTLDVQLLGPRLDLPLENVVWRLYLSDRWKVTDWDGTLEFQDQQRFAGNMLDLQGYIRQEDSLQQNQIREAEQLVSLGNTYLQQGDPQQARRAFQAAYGMSQHDDAFNEDARVQLHNLKTQQALIGLNNRVAVVSGDAQAPLIPLADTPGLQPAYKQDQAREILDRSSAEDNAVQMKLAERLVQQQEAASPNPGALRAAVPEGGCQVTFTRSLMVDPFADLSLHLQAQAPQVASGTLRAGVLAACLLAFAALAVRRRTA